MARGQRHDRSQWPCGTTASGAWNIWVQGVTTVRYPINYKGTAPPGTGMLDPNTILGSMHSGAANILMGDGSGRTRTDSPIDPGVGFTVQRHPGERVDRGEPLVLVHHRPGQDVAEVCRRLAAAFRIADRAEPTAPLLITRLEARSR